MMLRGLLLTCGRRRPGIRLLSSSSSEPAVPPNLILPSGLKDGPIKFQRPSVDLSRPVVRVCKIPVPPHLSAQTVWLETLNEQEDEPKSLVQLHPDVFDVPPRIDILHQVITWQRNFKRISYAKTKTRAEVRGGGRKPWAQKGTGRARQGSIRSPLWRGGGVAHGPRGPTSYYYMLPMKVRALGLKTALTTKLAQNDLYIIDSIEIPSPDPQYLVDLFNRRHWGESVLIVDVNEDMPENIFSATVDSKKINLIPAIGMNVYSMLKHDTILLTIGAVDFLEEKLLWQDSRYTALYPFKLPYSDFP
ncbi:39S ribosomal protein L4, mitochondrial isoform X1 [Bufo bufo]|uniref:39S ribosomal protein L4, mitochondrial isoform X1 n=1 Tax=Bufo bufo TaxID=8384 RepID=UPI001ABED4D7|nr:39S ribosomal protein L4, mitochondrial isoform X1 [Bufo bufo]